MINSDVLFFLFMPFGSFAIGRGLSFLRKQHQIKNTPRSKARSAAMGLVELSGVGRTNREITDPIWNLPCCRWRCLVQEWRKIGKHYMWVDVVEKTSPAGPLYLEDETGKILIDDHKAVFYGDETIVKLKSSNYARLAPVLSSWGIDTSWFRGFWTLSLSALRIKMQILRLESPLFIFGELTHRAVGRAGQRGVSGEFVKGEDEASEPQSSENDDLVVRATADEPLVLSANREHRILSTLGWNFFLYTLCGIAMNALGVRLALFNGYSYEVTASVAVLSFAAGLGMATLTQREA